MEDSFFSCCPTGTVAGGQHAVSESCSPTFWYCCRRSPALGTLTGVFDNVPGIDHGRGASFAGLEADHYVVSKVGFTMELGVRHRDWPVFHVGKGALEVADEPPLLGIRR